MLYWSNLRENGEDKFLYEKNKENASAVTSYFVLFFYSRVTLLTFMTI